jgi:hypothetical protein
MDECHPWLTSTLWPGASIASGWSCELTRFVAVPNSAQPTQLLPYSLTSVRAAATRASDFRPRSRQWRDAAGVLGLLALASFRDTKRLAVRDVDPSIVEHFRDSIDSSIKTAVVLCGPPRANQKPVLQLCDRRGVTIAFAKVAWNDLTGQLLVDEHRALTALNAIEHEGFHLPRVLGSGTFGAGQYLALSPVTVGKRVPASEQKAFTVAKAIELTAPAVTTKTADSPFVSRLLQLSQVLPIANGIVNDLSVLHADQELPLRAWHGDFVPWNLLSGETTAAVWDWERYDQQVPIGFDRLHFAFQTGSYRTPDATLAAVEALAARLDSVLPELDQPQAQAHLDWYLAEMICRYEHDAQIVPVPALTERVHQLSLAVQRRRNSS